MRAASNIPPSGATIDSPTFTGIVHGGMTRLGTWGVPMIHAPSGTMANNGAVTLGTALPRVYANCYLWLPAGAIAAGVPASAGYYFTQMSSTTAGTVFNNTYTSGVPSLPASPTAFATTGPGAFTGDTTSEAGVILTVPANIGTNAEIYGGMYHVNNNSVGTKTPRIRLNGASGTVYAGAGQTTNTDAFYEAHILNNTTATQRGVGRHDVPGAAGLDSIVTSSVDTSVATDIRFTHTKNTATDYSILEFGRSFLYAP